MSYVLTVKTSGYNKYINELLKKDIINPATLTSHETVAFRILIRKKLVYYCSLDNVWKVKSNAGIRI